MEKMVTTNPFYGVQTSLVNAIPNFYIIYSKERGLFLGDDKWSKIKNDDNPGTGLCLKWAEVKALCHALELDDSNCSVIQVYPDLPDNRITQNALMNAHIPRW